MTDREADEAMKQVRGTWRHWALLAVTLIIAGWGGFELWKQRNAARASLSDADARVAERTSQLAVVEQAKAELDRRLAGLDGENKRLQSIEKRERSAAEAQRAATARLGRLSALLSEKMAAETKANLLHIGASDAIEIEMTDKLLFDAADPTGTTSAIVSKKGEETLLLLAGVLTSTAGLAFEVGAHTDEIPTAWEASAARAAATARVLAEKARMDPKALEVRAYGASRPAATNKNAAGRAKNRRVVLRVSIPK
jgi:flagellar motor protein MotB